MTFLWFVVWLICDLIGDQLGNFWWGGQPARLGRFDDAANVQGANSSGMPPVRSRDGVVIERSLPART